MNAVSFGIRSLFCLIVLLLDPDSLSNDQPKNFPMRTIATGSFSGIQEPTQLVITNQTQWEEIWKKHAVRKSPQQPAPEINFAKETVLFAAMGRKNSGGYKIQITSVEIKGDELIASISEKSPGEGSLTIQALTAPFHIVAVETAGLPVKFEKSANP